MAEKNILEQLLDNKPNANQFDFLKKRGATPTALKVRPPVSCSNQDHGGNPDSNKTPFSTNPSQQ